MGLLRAIKNAFVRLWVWLTPRAAKNQIEADLLERMRTGAGRPRFAQHLSQPLVRRVFPSQVVGNLIQVQPLPEGARPIYDKMHDDE